MGTEQKVSQHYTRPGFAAALRAGLLANGKDPDRLTPEDLAAVDEFHVGGAAATDALFTQVAPAVGSRWLDLGSGIGGPARHLASRYGCDVTGIDLTDDFVAIAVELTRLTGLTEQVRFRQGSVLELPFDDASFDGVCLLHVGMNIADKATLCANASRVLRPGGHFVIYDQMRVGDGEPRFPLPWASSADTSFVATPAEYRAALETAGLRVIAERERAALGVAFFDAMQARAREAGGPPPLGLHLLMGENFAEKAGNLRQAMASGIFAPVELIALRPAS